MKYLYITLSLFLLASCADEKKPQAEAKPEKTDLDFYKLKGNVTSVSEKSYIVSDGKNEPGNEVASEHDTDRYFDENGLLISEKKWQGNKAFEESSFANREKLLRRTQFLNGVPSIVTENQWDAAGDNILATIRRNPDNSQLDKVTYKYENGKPVEKVSYSAQDNALDKTTYLYDKNGNLVGEDLYIGTEIIKAKTKYKYDADNHKIAESRYSGEKLNYTTTYQYNGKNLIKKETTDDKGLPEYTEVFTYDAADNVFRQITIERYDNSETTDEYKYDKNKNVTLWEREKKGSPKISIANVYDDKGNLVSVRTTDASGKVLEDRKYIYTYDSNNNWTKKSVIIFDKPTFSIERKITYKEEAIQ